MKRKASLFDLAALRLQSAPFHEPGFFGIGFATICGVLHFEDIGPASPRLPNHRLGFIGQGAASTIVHAAVGLAIIAIARLPVPALDIKPVQPASHQHVEVRHLVFTAPRVPPAGGGGGGGGGNRQTGPIRHAEGIGTDAITVRIQRSHPAVPVDVEVAPTESVQDEASLPAVLLEAVPLASGTSEQIGLPTGGVSFGTSTGSGSGGGVGTGVGTGIGSGRGPGIGPGVGGGTGGGAYRPGGAVTAPRVITEVKPTYSGDALARKIQGVVVLELVVTREGHPSQIRVIESLDPEGLDQQAVAAAARWRFEPGRVGGTPVDVLVTLMLDFRIW